MSYRKVTTAEKVGRVPKKLAGFVKQGRERVASVSISDDVHLRDVSNWDKGDFFKWLKEVSGQTVKMSGVSALWLMEYLTRGVNKVFIDNRLVRNLEQVVESGAKKAEQSIDVSTGEKRGETKLTRFMKKYPWVLGYFTYWSMLVASYGAAGMVGEAVLADDKEAPKKEIKQDSRSELKIIDASGNFVDTSQSIILNPADSNFINQCVALENITCIPIIYTETHRAEPVVQRGENVWTHGWGMTWSPDKDGNMTIRDYADTKSNKDKKLKAHKPKKTANLDEDIEQTQSFLRGHVYGAIQKHMKRPITENEFYAICVAGYQLEGHIDDICKNLNEAKTPQEIADAFITPNYDRYGGTPKRRWVCGMLAAGYINMQDILEADIDNFYQANLNTLVKKNHFVTDKNTIEYVLGLKGTQKTGDMVALVADGRLAIKQLGGYVPQKTVAKVETEVDKQISESMYLLRQASEKFMTSDYSAAAELYERAIEKDVDNMEAYSSLALTYKKLGDKNKSIEYYEKCVAVVKKGNARMNANKSLLLDRSVKAASYFNAGAAREEIAKICLERGDKATARTNYNLAIKNYKTALENAEMGELGAERKDSYKSAIDRVTKKLIGLGKEQDKRHAMNRAVREMHKKNSRSDLLIYGTTHKGNIA